MQLFISSKKDIKDKLEKNPSYISELLKQSDVVDILVNLPETQKRIEAIQSKEASSKTSFPKLKYNSLEIDLFEKETKRAIYALGENLK